MRRPYRSPCGAESHPCRKEAVTDCPESRSEETLQNIGRQKEGVRKVPEDQELQEIHQEIVVKVQGQVFEGIGGVQGIFHRIQEVQCRVQETRKFIEQGYQVVQIITGYQQEEV